MGWALGGGTALMLALNHRVSKDVDIFFENARALRLLAPSGNALTRGICDDWQQPGHYIKLLRAGVGEVDFLVSRTFENEPDVPYEFIHGKVRQVIRVETPREILSKKIFHRASQFTTRDIFDAAAIIYEYPFCLEGLSPDVIEKLPRLVDRVARVAGTYAREIRGSVIPLDVDMDVLVNGAEFILEWFRLELERSKAAVIAPNLE
jgi:hypothetical protein